MKQSVPIILLIALFVVFITNPDITYNGVTNGIVLFIYRVFPALFPFILINNLLISLGIIKLINKVPFGNPYFVYNFIIGILCGYPMGAKIAADLYQHKCISKSQATFMMCVTNLPSLSFLLNYVLYNVLAGSFYSYVFMFIFYFTMTFMILIYYFIYRKKEAFRYRPYNYKENIFYKKVSIEDCIQSSIESIVKIGVYIIFFSCIVEFFYHMKFLSPIVCAILIGLIEITNGIYAIGNLEVDIIIKVTLLLSICSFGGFCTIFQTTSVINKTDLSINKYFLCKSMCLLLMILIILYSLIFTV